METTLDHDKYSAYLNQHLVAADAGVQSFRAAADSWAGSPWAEVFEQLHKEEQEAHAKVRAIIEELDYDVSSLRNTVSGVLGALGRANPVNPTRSRDGSMTQAELDALVVAIRGQQCMWETLSVLADMDERLDKADCDAMVERCRNQQARVVRVSAETAHDRFTRPGDA